ncbi:hypothetical protein IVG45_07135 [Methylomonas sp. LL1]|uniref:hypothetical protein n=1 Tax=Methylomonas sp. LL1 TaxID=2785785 RepID=UPI0018C3BEF2|nr:hypothetical protein [Methylomonas sp. LL1]QPK64718.1 hypothetical protein IVG45_07135 [Methylomonas sp. LL1]
MRQPSLFWRLKWLLVLLTLMVLDFTPIPFSAGVCLYVFLFRPLWFKTFIERLYASK